MQPVDFILEPEWLAPMDHHPGAPKSEILKNASVAVHQGEIVAIGPRQEVLSKYPGSQTIQLENRMLIPGLVNAHTHAAMTLLRGYADDLPLMQWLNDYIWPAEAKWVNKEFIQAGTDLAITEMLRSGTTCFNDMYFYPDVTAERARAAGIRACVGMIVLDFPTVWASSADEYISKGLEMRDALRHSKLVSTAFAPHAPYTVSDKPLERIRTLADELDCQIHMHVHETRHEVEESSARFGVRPLERLDQLGLLTPKLQAVHMTQLLPAEIDTIAERGIHIVHCPESNLKLASGFCPVAALFDAGLNIALGTDGASSNNDMDMLGEMRSAALLSKGVSGDPTSSSAYTTLYAATMGGAAALGLDECIGSIEVGKRADLVAVDFSAAETQPVYHPLSQLVYSASREQVTDVWVDGIRQLENRRVAQLDYDNVVADAAAWGLKIASHAPA